MHPYAWLCIDTMQELIHILLSKQPTKQPSNRLPDDPMNNQELTMNINKVDGLEMFVGSFISENGEILENGK